MSITVSCPQCHARFRADDRIAGREVGCPKCNGKFVVPKTSAPSEPPPMPVPVAVAVSQPKSVPDPFDHLGKTPTPNPASSSDNPFDLLGPPEKSPTFDFPVPQSSPKSQRSWVVWLIPTLVFVVIAVVAASVVFRSSVSSEDVEIVKRGRMPSFPNMTIGEAIDGFMSNPQWSTGTAADGMPFVNVKGGVVYMNKQVTALLQFAMERDRSSFRFRALEFNDIPQNRFVAAELFSKMFNH